MLLSSPSARRKKAEVLYCFAAILCIFLKCFLVKDLPIYIRGDALHDDFMMYNLARNLTSSEWLGYRIWLGEYNKFTLTKGCFFPLFLALSHFSHIPYTLLFSIVYGLSCLFFCRAVKPIICCYPLRFFLYFVLLFSPASFSVELMQRIYRCGITMSQVLFITGGILGIYLRIRGENSAALLFYGFVGGIGLGSFVLTREDYIWMFPFVITVSLIVLIIIFTQKRSFSRSLLKITSILLPLLISAGCTASVSFLNNHYYGIRTENELNDHYFKDAIQAIYSVKDDEDIPFCTVSRSKMHRICDISPTLNSIREILDQGMDLWDNFGEVPYDGEVEDGFFFWCLRDCAAAAGYYQSPQTANAFYQKVAEEVVSAMEDGRLEKQSVMPSALMSPWRESYREKIIPAIFNAGKYVISFQDLQAEAPVCSDNNVSPASDWENLTGNYALTPNSGADLIAMANSAADRINRFGSIYSSNTCIFILSVFFFVFSAVHLAKDTSVRDAYLRIWLISLSLFLSAMVLFIGVGYTHISAYKAIKSSYLSGGYPLILASEWLSVFCGSDIIFRKLKHVKCFSAIRQTSDNASVAARESIS